MTREQFDQLVREIEKRYEGRPEALAQQAARWAWVGYGWFLGTAGVVLTAGSVFLLLGIRAGLDGVVFFIIGGLILVFGGVGVIRNLWIRLPAPKGREVSASEAPVLHQRLQELRLQLNSLPLHKVLIVSEYNAAVVQSPRWGVLGWWRNYLILGLPLMETLSEKEFCAVIAHEFAHLSRSHGRFTHWVYRLRRVWDQVFQKLQAPQEGEISMRILRMKFIRWFWPRFNAHAFALSRANEYEADALAASVTSIASMRSALVRLDVNGRHVEKTFWRELWVLSASQPQPPECVFAKLCDSVRALAGTSDAERWESEALRQLTTNADTHPCLSERLRALLPQNSPATLALSYSAQSSTSGAEVLLGSALEGIRREVEAEWKKEVQATWQDRHAKATVLQHHLSVLDTAPSSPDADALWDKAMMKLELEGLAPSEPLVREVLKLQPRHSNACLMMGRILLDRGDAEGVSWAEKSMEAEEEFVPHACQVLLVHFRATGQGERLRATEARLDQHEAAVRASHVERNSVSATDDFIAHGLSSGEWTALQQTLTRIPELATARLGRKSLLHFPTQRLFVLEVTAKKRWYQFLNSELDEVLVRRVSKEIQLPGRLLVFSPKGSFRGIARKLARLPDCEVYRAARNAPPH